MNIAPRTGVLAVREGMAERRQPTQDWTRLCQFFCRTRFGIGPGAKTAYLAFQSAQHRHDSGPSSAPYGTIGYMKGPKGAAGHAVVMVGDGNALSNDIRTAGRISLVSVHEILVKWPAYDWVGWTEDTNGARFYGFAPSISAEAVRKAQKGDHIHGHGSLLKRELADAVGNRGMKLSSDTVGAPMGDAVKVLQRRLGFKATGLIGPRVLGYLADRNHAFTARP